jgi:molybdate transport system substrate-binding protein
MKKLLFICAIFLGLAVQSYAQDFSIAAAADLRYALTEVVAKYREADSTYKIDVIYGSSGKLYQQLTQQAPFDMFFSADNSYPQKLDEQKLIVGKPKLYAIGHLVLWSASKDVSKGLAVLKSDDIKRISIANPEVAPYGKRAVEALKYYKLEEATKDKIVKGDNVSQAAQFCLTGNADCGLIALSLAISPEMSGKGKFFQVDAKSHSPLEQSYVILKKAENNKNVAKFVKFIASKKARAIFAKYGFKLPTEK